MTFTDSPDQHPVDTELSQQAGTGDASRHLMTGGTGFIGSRLISRLLWADPQAQIWVLVRRRSLGRFAQTAYNAGWGTRVLPLIGDVTAPRLGLSAGALAELGEVDQVIHCAAMYDLTADDAMQRAANVEGTRAVIGLAKYLDATLHHVSSIAVAGNYAGTYTETDFDVGQQFPTPYHQTKFEAESLVRNETGLRYRIYRPGVVVGDSDTGEIDKIDGPYYFFGLLEKLARLPRFVPIRLPDVGRNNLVPVDYVVDALAELIRLAGHDGETFHLTAPEAVGLCGIYRALEPAAGLPPLRGTLPRWTSAPVINATGRVRIGRNWIARRLGIPGEVLDVIDSSPKFTNYATQAALSSSGITTPEFQQYAPNLWHYWATRQRQG